MGLLTLRAWAKSELRFLSTCLFIVRKERDAAEEEVVKLYRQLPKRDAKGKFAGKVA